MLSCLLNNQRINCFDDLYNKEQLKKWANKDILLCPVCGKPYEYCHGKVRTPYFRHKDKVKCEDKYSEAETEEHLIGKCDLYEWIKKQDGITDVILEGWIPETKQRPDIMFRYNGDLCVIEYQCSPISSEYYERHELYKASGIKDIWICGTKKYLQCYHTGYGNKKVNELEKECRIYYDSTYKYIFTVNKNIIEKDFKSICDKKFNKKSHNRLMRNLLDYSPGYKNYFLIKDKLQSYESYTYWPTGRRSNKHLYPSTGYNFDKNYSIAECMNLNSLKLNGIK